MEERTNNILMTAPRITFKRTSVKKRVAWEIASSSSKDKEELKLIVDMIEEINGDMEKRFEKKLEKKLEKKSE